MIDRLNAGIVGPNPTQGMDVSVVCVYSVFRYRSRTPTRDNIYISF
jgi:hypothetical protein